MSGSPLISEARQSGTEIAPGASNGIALPPSHARTLEQLATSLVERNRLGDVDKNAPITLHDAAHQFCGIAPTIRGEWQQTIIDVVGIYLMRRTLGARGFINEIDELRADDSIDERLTDLIEQNDRHTLVKRLLEEDLGEVLNTLLAAVEKKDLSTRNEWREPENSPYHALPVNDPRRLQIPQVSPEELTELVGRAVEFYSQVIRQVKPIVDRGDAREGAEYPQQNGEPLKANGPAAYIHRNASSIIIEGGYDRPATLPYGPIGQFLEMPAELTVDEGRMRHHWVALLHERIQMERLFVRSESDDQFEVAGGTVPGAPSGMSQNDYLSSLIETRDRVRQVGSVAADEHEVRVRGEVARVGGLRHYPELPRNAGNPSQRLIEHDQLVEQWVQAGYGGLGSARMWNAHLDGLGEREDDAVIAAIVDSRRFRNHVP